MAGQRNSLVVARTNVRIAPPDSFKALMLDVVAGSAIRSGALVHGAHTGKALGA
jgi:hypothetical protein